MNTEPRITELLFVEMPKACISIWYLAHDGNVEEALKLTLHLADLVSEINHEIAQIQPKEKLPDKCPGV